MDEFDETPTFSFARCRVDRRDGGNGQAEFRTRVVTAPASLKKQLDAVSARVCRLKVATIVVALLVIALAAFVVVNEVFFVRGERKWNGGTNQSEHDDEAVSKLSETVAEISTRLNAIESTIDRKIDQSLEIMQAALEKRIGSETKKLAEFVSKTARENREAVNRTMDVKFAEVERRIVADVVGRVNATVDKQVDDAFQQWTKQMEQKIADEVRAKCNATCGNGTTPVDLREVVAKLERKLVEQFNNMTNYVNVTVEATRHAITDVMNTSIHEAIVGFDRKFDDNVKHLDVHINETVTTALQGVLTEAKPEIMQMVANEVELFRRLFANGLHEAQKSYNKTSYELENINKRLDRIKADVNDTLTKFKRELLLELNVTGNVDVLTPVDGHVFAFNYAKLAANATQTQLMSTDMKRELVDGIPIEVIVHLHSSENSTLEILFACYHDDNVTVEWPITRKVQVQLLTKDLTVFREHIFTPSDSPGCQHPRHNPGLPADMGMDYAVSQLRQQFVLDDENIIRIAVKFRS